MRKHYIFAYDISDDDRQAALRKVLQAYATGCQDSLYECYLNDGDYKEIVHHLQRILTASDCCVAFLRPDARQLLGSARDLQYQPFIVC